MKSLTVLALGILMFTGCSHQSSTVSTGDSESTDVGSYPETKKSDHVDIYFGTEVPDPYRWLEDDLSVETREWIEAQNEITFEYLDRIPFRDRIEDRITALWNYERQSAPFKRGDYVYYYKNDGLQNHSVIYRFSNDDRSDEEVFLDPNTFSEDETTSLAGLGFSEDATLDAYAISVGGSDWHSVITNKVITCQLVSSC